MKRIVELLQEFAIAISIFFAFSPYELYTVANSAGHPYTEWFCWFLALSGTFIATIFVWFLTASWKVPHRGYLIAVGFSGILGMILGWTTIAYINQMISIDLQQRIVGLNTVFILGILIGFFVEWVIKPLIK